jgi:hypothetical protein
VDDGDGGHSSCPHRTRWGAADRGRTRLTLGSV